MVLVADILRRSKGFDDDTKMSSKMKAYTNIFAQPVPNFDLFLLLCTPIKLPSRGQSGKLTNSKSIPVFENTGDIYPCIEVLPNRRGIFKEHMNGKGISSGKTALHSLPNTRRSSCSDNLDCIGNFCPALLSVFHQKSKEKWRDNWFAGSD